MLNALNSRRSSNAPKRREWNNRFVTFANNGFVLLHPCRYTGAVHKDARSVSASLRTLLDTCAFCQCDSHSLVLHFPDVMKFCPARVTSRWQRVHDPRKLENASTGLLRSCRTRPVHTRRWYEQRSSHNSSDERWTPTVDRPSWRGQPSNVVCLPPLPGPLERKSQGSAEAPLHDRPRTHNELRRRQWNHSDPGGVTAAHTSVWSPAVQTLPHEKRWIPIWMVPRALEKRLHPLEQKWSVET